MPRIADPSKKLEALRNKRTKIEERIKELQKQLKQLDNEIDNLNLANKMELAQKILENNEALKAMIELGFLNPDEIKDPSVRELIQSDTPKDE